MASKCRDILAFGGDGGKGRLLPGPGLACRLPHWRRAAIATATTCARYETPWVGPFLRLSYHGGPGTPLWDACGGSPGSPIRLWLKVNERSSAQLLYVPFNTKSQRYEVEIWGYTGPDLRTILRYGSREALDSGALVVVRSSLRDIQMTLHSRRSRIWIFVPSRRKVRCTLFCPCISNARGLTRRSQMGLTKRRQLSLRVQHEASRLGSFSSQQARVQIHMVGWVFSTTGTSCRITGALRAAMNWVA